MTFSLLSGVILLCGHILHAYLASAWVPVLSGIAAFGTVTAVLWRWRQCVYRVLDALNDQLYRADLNEATTRMAHEFIVAGCSNVVREVQVNRRRLRVSWWVWSIGFVLVTLWVLAEV